MDTWVEVNRTVVYLTIDRACDSHANVKNYLFKVRNSKSLIENSNLPYECFVYNMN